MQILKADSCDFVRVAFETWLAPPDSYWLATCDVVFAMLSSCLVDIGYVPVEDLVGDVKLPSQTSPEYEYFVNKPVNDPYSWIVDQSRYGTRLSGLNKFMSVLGYVSSSSFKTGDEHDVRHDTCYARGTGFPASSWISPSWNVWAQLPYAGQYAALHNGFSTNCPTYRVEKIGGVDRNRYECVGDNYYGYTPIRLSDFAEGFRDFLPLSLGPARPWNKVWSAVSFPSFEVSSSTNYQQIVVQYQVRWNLSWYLTDLWINPGYYWLMTNKLVFNIVPKYDATARELVPIGARPIVGRVSGNWDFTSTCVEAGGYAAPWTYTGGYLLETPYNNSNIPSVGHVDHSFGRLETVRLTSFVSHEDTSVFRGNNSFLYRKDPFGVFAGAVRGDLPDIRASSFMSTSDAFDQAIGSVENNMIENLVELPHFLEVLPDLKVLMTLLKSIRPDIGSVFDVLKWLAEERLRLSFTTLPNVGLIIETLPRIVSLMGHLSNLARNPIKGYGQFTFEFPQGSFGRDSSFLVTRTKAVMNSYPDGPLATVLGLDALGLLPTASNLWDLVPLSFVVDWAFNVSDRLKDAENFAIMALLGFRVLVHSYTVYTPVTQQEMDSYGVHLVSSIGNVVKVYVREVTAHMPFPRNSRWDFRFPSRPPNWMVAGSLFLSQV